MNKLNTQEFLAKHDFNFDVLTQQFGIQVKHHEFDNRVILNYSQIDSYVHKFHPVVRECRGLVLDSNTGDVVARAFDRFFNLGEHGESDENFDWTNYYIQEKIDGSLILLYYWNGSWHVNTRNSFGGGQVGESNYTWRQLVFDTLGDVLHKVPKYYTYVMELCSPYNQVVKRYDEPTLFLLSCFTTHYEVPYYVTQTMADHLDVQLPRRYMSHNLELVVSQVEAEDVTNEGVVLRDFINNRIKVKTESYVRLHRLYNNANIESPKNLIPVILKGEIDEVLTYWPSLQDKVDKVNGWLDQKRREIDNLWFVHGDEQNRKKFALAVKDHSFSSLLFKAKDTGINPLELLNESPGLVIKVYENE